ncbi:MAG TPA: CBS domain-containing protein [Dehalococcoidia bacterium]|nr:CBS domain-containing protein [Dehalococcoidia bacterium]
MKALDIMNRPVVAAAPDTSARDIAIQMLMGGYSGMPITDRDGKVLGIVSEIDIIRVLRSGKSLDTATAQDFMTREVIAVDVSASVDEVMAVIDTSKIQRVPVTDDGKLVGIISRPDILRAYLEPKFMTFT